MSDKEIQELKERVYAISYSGFPLDAFFNDIRNVSDPRFNEMAAYRDLKLIVDKIYDLREKAKKYDEKETPKKPIMKPIKNEYTGEFEKYPFCPVCDNCVEHISKYCDECGQRLEL